MKVLAGVVITMALGLVGQWWEAEQRTRKMDAQAATIATLTQELELERVNTLEVEAVARSLEQALSNRNDELKQIAIKTNQQREYIRELQTNDKDTQDFLSCRVPSSIACLFLASGSDRDACGLSESSAAFDRANTIANTNQDD